MLSLGMGLLLYHSVGLFSILFFKCKEASVLEKRESVVLLQHQVLLRWFAEELRQVRKIIYKAIFSGGK